MIDRHGTGSELCQRQIGRDFLERRSVRSNSGDRQEHLLQYRQQAIHGESSAISSSQSRNVCPKMDAIVSGKYRSRLNVGKMTETSGGGAISWIVLQVLRYAIGSLLTLRAWNCSALQQFLVG